MTCNNCELRVMNFMVTGVVFLAMALLFLTVVGCLIDDVGSNISLKRDQWECTAGINSHAKHDAFKCTQWNRL